MEQVRSIRSQDLVKEDRKQGLFRVHGSVYTDPEILEREMEKIWNNSWVYLAHDSQIANPDDYITTYIGRQPVILCRDEQGRIKSFLNRCRHKGTVICRSDLGNSSKFRCSYHGWTYRNDGKLIGIPGREGYSKDFDIENLSLVEVPLVESYKGWIFGSLSTSVPSLSDYLGNTRPFLDLIATKYSQGIEVVPGTFRFTMYGNWKLHVDNSLDSYHPLFAHKSVMQVLGSLGRDNLVIRDKIPALDLGNGHSVFLHTREDSIDLYDGGSYAPDPDLLKNIANPTEAKWASDIKGFHLFVFPNLVIFDQGPPSFEIRIIRPLTVDETDLTFYCWAPRDCGPKMRERILSTFVSAAGPAGIVNIDDMEIMRAQTEGFNAKQAPFTDFSRGMHRERKDYQIREFVNYLAASPSTDDTICRGFFRHWAMIMK